MHSLKNTAVAVVLLAVSFGLYQYSLTEKKAEIDPSLIPDVEISDGLNFESADASMFGSGGSAPAPANLDANNSNATNPAGASATFSKSGFGAGFAAPNLSMPASTKPPVQPDFNTGSNPAFGSAELASPSFDRKPVIATTNNNVQSIKYPNSSSDLVAPNSGSNPAPEISQRALVSADRDAGLIEALQNEGSATRSPFAPIESSPVKPQSQFQPTPTPPAASTNAGNNNQFGGNSFAAAPIPSTQTEIENATAEVASATLAAGSDFAGAMDANRSAAGMDSNVAQAGSELLLPKKNINAAWAKVDQLVAASDFHSALKLLSPFYRSEDLTGPQRQRLLAYLDALAGKVIFSAENHLADQPYTVGPNESLPDIAKKWGVPAQVIFNVNRDVVSNPAVISPGTKLKPIPGPFSSEIDLRAGVMTLFLGDLYAGRFPIVVGISGEPKPGDYTVMMKSAEGFTWRDSNGVDYPPGAPQNGYGPNWIGLSGSLCMHAVADAATAGHHGCIGLKGSDALDVFAILSESSRVKIIR